MVYVVVHVRSAFEALLILFVLGFNDTSHLVGHLAPMNPEKGRKEIEEIVEGMKERDRGERGK